MTTTQNGPKDAPLVLIVGGDSGLGSELARLFALQGQACLLTTRRREQSGQSGRQWLDLSSRASVESFAVPPGAGVAFLLAANSSIEACRNNPSATSEINVNNTLRLAKRLKERGCRLVFPSTSLVFDGKTPLPGPESPVSPLTEYGRQKRQAEEELLAMDPRALVVRLAKVVGPGFAVLQNFAQALHEGRSVRAFYNLIFAPIAREKAVMALAGLAMAEVSGIFHVSPADELSYFEAAKLLAQRLGRPEALVKASDAREVLPVEQLPEHPALEASAASQVLGWDFPSSRACLAWLFRDFAPERGV